MVRLSLIVLVVSVLAVSAFPRGERRTHHRGDPEGHSSNRVSACRPPWRCAGDRKRLLDHHKNDRDKLKSRLALFKGADAFRWRKSGHDESGKVSLHLQDVNLQPKTEALNKNDVYELPAETGWDVVVHDGEIPRRRRRSLEDASDDHSDDDDEDVSSNDNNEDVSSNDNNEDVSSNDNNEDVSSNDNNEDVSSNDNNDDVSSNDNDEDVSSNDNNEDVSSNDYSDDSKYRKRRSADSDSDDNDNDNDKQQKTKDNDHEDDKTDSESTDEDNDDK